MTVQELRDFLAQMPPDREVVVVTDLVAGDVHQVRNATNGLDVAMLYLGAKTVL